MKTISNSEFNAIIKEISGSAKFFDDKVQQGLLACVYNIIEHKNTDQVSRLLVAMGRSTRKAKAAKYLVNFLTVGDEKLINVTKTKDGYSVKFVSKDHERNDKIRDVVKAQYDMRRRVKWFDLDTKKDAKVESTAFAKLEKRVDSLANADVSDLSVAEKRLLKLKLTALLKNL